MADRFSRAVNLLRAGFPAANIVSELYADIHGSHPLKMQSWTEELACLAAHYGNRQLMLALLEQCVDPVVASPLLTATYNRRYSLVKLLVARGKDFRSDERTRGIVTADKVTQERQSPMEIAFIYDDPHMMTLLKVVYASPCIPLAHLALQYNAHRCFQALLEEQHASLNMLDCIRRDLLLTAASSEYSLLKRVIDLHIGDATRRTAMEGKTAIHLALSPSTRGHCPVCQHRYIESNLITSDLPAKLELLIQGGANASLKDIDGRLPLDWLIFQAGIKLSGHASSHALEEHSRTVLAACKVILTNMPPSANSASVVPRETVKLLLVHQRVILRQIENGAYSLGSDTSALTLLQNILKLLLQKGVDLQAELVGEGTILDTFFAGFRHYTPPVSAVPFLHDSVRLLLIYGARLTQHSFPILDRLYRLQWQDEAVGDRCREMTYMCASMMPHTQFQEYRVWHEWQRNEGQQLPCVPVCQSLQDMCRVKLYDALPHRRMAAWIEQLDPPYLMRRYLTMWA